LQTGRKDSFKTFLLKGRGMGEIHKSRLSRKREEEEEVKKRTMSGWRRKK